VVSATGVSEVSVPRTGASGSLQPPVTEAGMVCAPKMSRRGTGMSEAIEGLSAGSWSRTAGHSPCTWCQLLDVKYLYVP